MFLWRKKWAFERPLESSLQLGANIYSNQIRIHHQVLRQWKRYHEDSGWREELDGELKAKTGEKIESIKVAFESGMKFSVFLRHKKRIKSRSFSRFNVTKFTFKV